MRVGAAGVFLPFLADSFTLPGTSRRALPGRRSG